MFLSSPSKQPCLIAGSRLILVPVFLMAFSKWLSLSVSVSLSSAEVVAHVLVASWGAQEARWTKRVVLKDSWT
jgi:hypothetical protein